MSPVFEVCSKLVVGFSAFEGLLVDRQKCPDHHSRAAMTRPRFRDFFNLNTRRLRETRLFPVAHGTTKTLVVLRFCRPTTTPQPSEGKVWYFAIIASQAIIEK
jgi:hypothetical protein